jgi:hypothetical protein
VRPISLHRAATLAAEGLVALFAALRADADVVKAGHDPFQTITSGSDFNGVPYRGVSPGNSNSGGSIVVKSVGNTDTILQRLADSTAPAGGSATAALRTAALRHMNSAPTSGFGSTDFLLFSRGSHPPLDGASMDSLN